jgi:hypothetical protein
MDRSDNRESKNNENYDKRRINRDIGRDDASEPLCMQ